MAYFVYILYSSSTDSFYKGQTADLDERLLRHNNKYEKATSSGTPWILIWADEKKSRSEESVHRKTLFPRSVSIFP